MSETNLSLITQLSAAPPPPPPSLQWKGLQGPEVPQPNQGPTLILRQTLSATCHCMELHHSLGPRGMQDNEGATPASLPIALGLLG